MSRITQFRSTWNRLKQLDQRAGHFAGNSGHMRKDGGDPIDYALALAGRTLIAGFAFALVQLLGAIVFTVYPAWGIYAGMCEGLVLLALAGYLYPGKWEFMFGILFGLSPVGIAAASAGLHGIPVETSLSVILGGYADLILAPLAALCGIKWLASIILQALDRRFPKKPKPAPRPGTLAYYTANKLLTPEENTARQTWLLVFCVCGFVGFIMMIAGVIGSIIWGTLSLGLIPIGVLVLLLSFYLVDKRLVALRERVRARLALLEPAPQKQAVWVSVHHY